MQKIPEVIALFLIKKKKKCIKTLQLQVYKNSNIGNKIFEFNDLKLPFLLWVRSNDSLNVRERLSTVLKKRPHANDYQN